MNKSEKATEEQSTPERDDIKDTLSLNSGLDKKAEELKVMKSRINNALNSPEVRKKVEWDFTYTFKQIGLDDNSATEMTNKVISMLLEYKPLDEIERDVLNLFEGTELEEKNLVEILDEKLTGRADLIYSQVSPHLRDTKGTLLDYGTGDGQVAQFLQDRDGHNVTGVDVRDYRAEGVTIPIGILDSGVTSFDDDEFDTALMTNVAHHEASNESIINELNRITTNKLVVIETVPTGDTPEEIEADRERTFMNDYFYNRLFHNADIPVPGTYETPQGWIDRFEKHGWKTAHSENLGYDQPTIRDVHHLFVFEK